MGNIKGAIPFQEIYMIDTQGESDPRNTKKLLLSHGKYRSFPANGKAWTFSGVVSVEPPYYGKGDLVDITKNKFKEAEGQRNSRKLKGPAKKLCCTQQA